MTQDAKLNSEEKSLRWMKYILLGVGEIFVIVGVIRQWPVAGKTYMEFIEGDGYLSLMLGLIIIVLGFSVRLFAGQEDEN